MCTANSPLNAFYSTCLKSWWFAFRAALGVWTLICLSADLVHIGSLWFHAGQIAYNVHVWPCELKLLPMVLLRGCWHLESCGLTTPITRIIYCTCWCLFESHILLCCWRPFPYCYVSVMFTLPLQITLALAIFCATDFLSVNKHMMYCHLGDSFHSVGHRYFL